MSAKFIHGRTNATCKTYRAWAAMIQRCTNRNHIDWRYWGGRGIRVCDRWRTFTNFFADMGESPPKLSLDRIDNNGHYEPGNCRWATPTEQTRNQRRNRCLISEQGERKTLSEWAKVIGFSRQRLHQIVTLAKKRQQTSCRTHGMTLHLIAPELS